MRFDKITKFAGIASCAAALPISAVAQQWQLIDDFESYTETSYIRGGDPDLVYPGASNGGLGVMDIWGTDDGIEGVGGEKAAHFWHGETQGSEGDFWHQLPLPSEIGIGETGTVYFRLWQDGYDLNWHIMLSKNAAGSEPNGAALWANQATIMRFDTAGTIVIDAHNGTNYSDSTDALVPELETWYEYWIVANNVSANEGYYEVYYRAPGGEQELILWNVGDTPTSKLNYRNKADTSIKALVIARQGAAGVIDLYLIDDIWYSEGENLTTPGVVVPPCDNPWADWCDEDGDGWINTGDGFLSWIYFDNTGWIFIQDLNQWVYLPAENVTASGAWTYLPRL